MKEKTIDFKTVLIKEQIEKLKVSEYAYAVRAGISEANYLRNKYNPNTLSGFITTKANEIAYINDRYYNLKDEVKELLAANIVHPDNEKLIKILLEKNINYETLCSYSKCISKIKQIALLVDEFDLNTDVQLVTKKINALCNVFKDYMGSDNYNLIIAKLNEIIVYEKDTYLALEKQYDTKKSKKK